MSSQPLTSKGETSAFSTKQIHVLKILSASLLELNSCVTHPGEDSHMKEAGMFIGNFELNP